MFDSDEHPPTKKRFAKVDIYDHFYPLKVDNMFILIFVWASVFGCALCLAGSSASAPMARSRCEEKQLRLSRLPVLYLFFTSPHTFITAQRLAMKQRQEAMLS